MWPVSACIEQGIGSSTRFFLTYFVYFLEFFSSSTVLHRPGQVMGFAQISGEVILSSNLYGLCHIPSGCECVLECVQDLQPSAFRKIFYTIIQTWKAWKREKQGEEKLRIRNAVYLTSRPQLFWIMWVFSDVPQFLFQLFQLVSLIFTGYGVKCQVCAFSPLPHLQSSVFSSKNPRHTASGLNCWSLARLQALDDNDAKKK